MTFFNKDQWYVAEYIKVTSIETCTLHVNIILADQWVILAGTIPINFL